MNTLEQTANDYALNCFVNNPDVPVNESFKAGAEWQKEQYNLLLNLALSAAQELELLGPVDLANKIKETLAKLLQD